MKKKLNHSIRIRSDQIRSVAQSCPTLCNAMAPLSMEFSRQEFWSGLPFSSPGHLPHPGIKFAFTALQTDSLPLSHWESLCYRTCSNISGFYTKQQKYCLSDNQKCPSVQFGSVTQSCLTLGDPMNRRTPGLPVHHHLPEFTQTQIHRVCDAIQPSHPLSPPSPPAPNPSQHQSLFQ